MFNGTQFYSISYFNPIKAMFSVLSFFIPTSQKITNEIDLLNEMQNQSFDLNKSFFVIIKFK